MTEGPFPRTIYIESLDSVRFAPKTSSVPEAYSARIVPDPALAATHATTEILVSLLFGRRVVVPEPFSFDSAGFLDIAEGILGSRAAAKRIGKSHPLGDPFVLPLRPLPLGKPQHRKSPGFVGAVARMLRDPTFRLSGWPEELDKRQDLREKLATAMEGGSLRRARTELGDQFAERLDQLARVTTYFRSRDAKRRRVRIKTTRNPGLKLDELFLRLANATDLELASSGAPEGIARELRRGATTLADPALKLDLGKRSQVREHAHEHVSHDVYSGIVEFADSLYNEVVHDATRGSSVVFSTSALSRSEYVAAGQTLAAWARRKESAPQTHAGADEARREGEIHFDAEVLRRDLCIVREFQRDLWPTFWAVVKEPEFLSGLVAIESASRRSPGGRVLRTELVEALKQHAEFLGKAFAKWGLYLSCTREAKLVGGFLSLAKGVPPAVRWASEAWSFFGDSIGAAEPGVPDDVKGAATEYGKLISRQVLEWTGARMTTAATGVLAARYERALRKGVLPA